MTNANALATELVLREGARLLGRPLTAVEGEVALAYADSTCGVDFNSPGFWEAWKPLAAIRDTAFRASQAVPLRDLLPVLRLIGPYNAFEPQEVFEDLLAYLGPDTPVVVAREGSPCLYVLGARDHIRPEMRGEGPGSDPVDCLAQDVQADEVGCADDGALRLWWD